jgi:hypothetical protein
MDAKMTRRIALGTIISGLAAGPFVIHAIRKDNRRTEDVGDGHYTSWQDVWNKTIAECYPNVKQIDSSSTVVRFQPFSDASATYTVLSAANYVPSDSAGWNAVPDGYLKKCGECTVTAAGAMMQCKENDVFVMTPTSRDDSVAKQELTFFVRSNRLVPTVVNGKQILNASEWMSNPENVSCCYPYMNFVNDCPNENVAAAHRWAVNEYLGGWFAGNVERNVAGLFDVDSERTVRIITRQNIRFGTTGTIAADLLREIKPEAVRKRVQNELEEAERQNLVLSATLNAYYHIDSGLLVFSEYTKKTYRGTESHVVSNESTLTRVFA